MNTRNKKIQLIKNHKNIDFENISKASKFHFREGKLMFNSNIETKLEENLFPRKKDWRLPILNVRCG